MITLGDKFGAKKGNDYNCLFCNYKCCKKYSWDRHLTTSKHLKITNDYNLGAKENKGAQQEVFTCEFCNKEYQHRQNLWRHKQKCNQKEKLDDEPTEKELIMKILKQNSDLIKENFELRKEQTDIKEMILEIVKNGTMNNSHNTTNSHNKAFNLQFFLNETCKDAMNITEFVDSITLQLSDLEKVGEIGYVEGISNIIIKNLNKLDETKRPLHCTDKKRETIYIKDQGQWEKEDDNKTKLRKSIRKIANKNIKLITEFREKYPECRKSESSISNKYNKMIIEAMGGAGDNNVEKEEKIIKNITKVTTISQK